MDRIVLAQLTQLYMTLKLECPFYEVKYVELCQRLNVLKTRPAQQDDKGIMHSQKPEYTPSYLTCHQCVRSTAFLLSSIKPEQAILVTFYISHSDSNLLGSVAQVCKGIQKFSSCNN